ncbi:MAG TPA: hypothetical protein V6C81_18400 [Planktothrix sp.]|jgi:hypothetical protein
MSKIAFNEIPAWAQSAIKRTGSLGYTQMQHSDGSLAIQNGVARFNGALVAEPGEVVTAEDRREETIALSDLPGWARHAINDNQGNMLQWTQNGCSLQLLPDGSATFDGKRVVR